MYYFIINLKTIAELINFPIYLLEPIRFFVINALLYTNKFNAFILALIVPLLTYFSQLIQLR